MTAIFIAGILISFCLGFFSIFKVPFLMFAKFTCAILFAAVFYKFSFSYESVLFFFLVNILIRVSVIDWISFEIPFFYSLILFSAGVIFSFFNFFLGTELLERFFNSLLGAVVGGGILFVFALSGKMLYKKEVMGGGDIKLMAAIGTFIGWENVLFTIFTAAVLSSLTGLVLIIVKKVKMQSYLPFAAFLSAGTLISLFLR
jgi:leader peptidase (prepilin peptidase)/N-methyltransferase